TELRPSGHLGESAGLRAARTRAATNSSEQRARAATNKSERREPRGDPCRHAPAIERGRDDAAGVTRALTCRIEAADLAAHERLLVARDAHRRARARLDAQQLAV